METEFIAQEYSLTWKDHTQHVRESFTKLLQNSDFCDVTLYAEGQKIGAHKAFLTTCSEYFNQLFEDFKEERPIVVLKGIQFNILQHILKFIYNGEVSIDIDKLTEFLEAAEFLKIFGLIKGKTFKKATYCMEGTENSCNTDEFLPCKCGETEVLTQDLSVSESQLQPQRVTNGIANEKKKNSYCDTDTRKKVCSKKNKEAVQRMYRIDILSTKNVVNDNLNEAVEDEAKNTSDDNVTNEEINNSQCSLKKFNNLSNTKPVDVQEKRGSTKEKRRSQRLSSKQNETYNAKPTIITESRRTSEERNSSQESTLSNQSEDTDSEVERDSDLERVRSSSRPSDALKFGYHPGVINKKLIEEAKKSMTEDDFELGK